MLDALATVLFDDDFKGAAVQWGLTKNQVLCELRELSLAYSRPC